MRVFNIDITRKGISPVVQVTEYDAMSRFFTLVLRNGSADYEPPEGATYSVWYKTKDSHGWYDTITEPDNGTHPAVVADGNAFTIEIAEQATTSCGELALMINGDDGYQLTVSGIITRSDDIPGYDGEEVENYYNVYITEMRENAARAENAAATAIEYGASVEVDETAQQLIITHTDNTEDVQTWVTEAEAWAVGQRNGEDVPSTDETYHNNAKYYAQVAQESAGGASPIVTEASGSVAAFPDGANDVAVKSLVAEITPVQSGTGDPSPTNIRPISGRTGMTVTAARANLLPMPITSGSYANGVTVTVNDDKSFYISKASSSGWTTFELGTFTLPAGTYTLIESDDNNENASISLYSSSGEITNTRYTKRRTFTLNEATTITRATFSRSAAASNVLTKLMLFVGSTATASDYEPYTATEIPITWQTEAGTIYGGTLDVVSGVLTVDREYEEFDGSADEDIVLLASGVRNAFRCALAETCAVNMANKSITNSIRYSSSSERDADGITCRITSYASKNFYVFMPPEIVSNVEEMRAYLANQPLQLVYYIATPQTYNITPTEIKTLLGGNTIYTDAGAVSVEYVADTKLYIDNKVAELQALILEN